MNDTNEGPTRINLLLHGKLVEGIREEERLALCDLLITRIFDTSMKEIEEQRA